MKKDLTVTQSQDHKLVTITRQDLSVGYQIAQSCHSVADFAYHKPYEFKNWRENSNYKICLASPDEKSLTKLYNKLIEKGAQVIAFHEPDIGDEMTAITLLGESLYKNYTKYLPLAGKEYGSVASTVKQDPLKVKIMGSNPITPSIDVEMLDADLNDALHSMQIKLGKKPFKKKRL